jgi:DNA-binding MarR family transcriptional regulator
MSSITQPQENIELPDNVFELYVLFSQTNAAIIRAREIELAKFGLTTEQGVLLHTLIKKGGSSTLSEIAIAIVRQVQSVSTLVERMTRLGLVKKVKYPDKKKLQVSITDKGLEMYNNVPHNSVEMIFSVLSLKDRNTLAKYLQRLSFRSRNLLGLDYKHPFLP